MQHAVQRQVGGVVQQRLALFPGLAHQHGHAHDDVAAGHAQGIHAVLKRQDVGGVVALAEIPVQAAAFGGAAQPQAEFGGR
ncbi:hypothetical protein G6F45_014255 [Rhizopus arrhizus]|nr:hypothetical protein G6F45_014255 [Rhizopus arrhizus]